MWGGVNRIWCLLACVLGLRHALTIFFEVGLQGLQLAPLCRHLLRQLSNLGLTWQGRSG